jgi:hypothetical protein
MELIDGSETSAISNQTPGKHPKENILHGDDDDDYYYYYYCYY